MRHGYEIGIYIECVGDNRAILEFSWDVFPRHKHCKE